MGPLSHGGATLVRNLGKETRVNEQVSGRVMDERGNGLVGDWEGEMQQNQTVRG